SSSASQATSPRASALPPPRPSIRLDPCRSSACRGTVEKLPAFATLMREPHRRAHRQNPEGRQARRLAANSCEQRMLCRAKSGGGGGAAGLCGGTGRRSLKLARTPTMRAELLGALVACRLVCAVTSG